MSAIYVHIPFCEKKCFYCSFAVSIGQKKRTQQYLDCLDLESQNYLGRKIKTIYIGGGTPTFLEAQELELLFKTLRLNFDLSEILEITIEANPEGLTNKKLKALKANGITRISLGVQTFNDEFLNYLGRVHKSDEAIKAYDRIRSNGFNNISLDLMFGFPDQSFDQLQNDVKQICELKSEHISLYALTIDPKSRFFTKGVKLQSSDEQIEKYSYIMETLPAYGFEQYEVSNFAKTGYRSLHNIGYWNCEEYIGLGMGAHSFVDGIRFFNVEKLTEYISRITNNESPIFNREMISPLEQLTEALIFGLRMNDGVNMNGLAEKYNLKFRDDQLSKIDQLIQGGLLEVKNSNVKTTAAGRLVLDTISVDLL